MSGRQLSLERGRAQGGGRFSRFPQPGMACDRTRLNINFNLESGELPGSQAGILYSKLIRHPKYAEKQARDQP